MGGSQSGLPSQVGVSGRERRSCPFSKLVKSKGRNGLRGTARATSDILQQYEPSPMSAPTFLVRKAATSVCPTSIDIPSKRSIILLCT